MILKRVRVIERLDQGHLYPNLKGPRTDISRPRIEPGLPVWEASTLEKSHIDSLFAGYSEPLLGLRVAQHPAFTGYYFSKYQADY
jgi:hypothetical protein